MYVLVHSYMNASFIIVLVETETRNERQRHQDKDDRKGTGIFQFVPQSEEEQKTALQNVVLFPL